MISVRYHCISIFLIIGGAYYSIWMYLGIKFSAISVEPTKEVNTPPENESIEKQTTTKALDAKEIIEKSCSENQLRAQKRVFEACKATNESYKRVSRHLLLLYIFTLNLNSLFYIEDIAILILILVGTYNSISRSNFRN